MTSTSSSSLQIGGSTLAYNCVGDGPAVVVVHGIGGHKEDWAGLAQVLAAEHSVYTTDLLGFGESSKSGEVITIADQVAAIIALLDAENVAKADIVGNSLGGWVAATLAATYPDRVNRLILVDAAGFKAMFEGKPPVNFYPTTVAEMSNLLDHVRFDPATHTDAFAIQALAASMAAGDAQASAAVGQGMFVSERLEEVADRISAPTLVIWGAEDKLFPAGIADLVTGHIQGSRKVLIPNASHFPQLDNAVAFNAVVVEFLQR
ncbi:MAG: alpha/beta hydrolase [Rhodospirillaceae bacterium]|nr:alpha/beta hydrolase [Rhodospirillales bacterium]